MKGERHDGIWGNWGVAPRMLKLGTRYRWVGSFMHHPLVPGEWAQVLLCRRLDGLPYRYGAFGGQKNLLALYNKFWLFVCFGKKNVSLYRSWDAEHENVTKRLHWLQLKNDLSYTCLTHYILDIVYTDWLALIKFSASSPAICTQVQENNLLPSNRGVLVCF
jgi:hypothetical protein